MIAVAVTSVTLAFTAANAQEQAAQEPQQRELQVQAPQLKQPEPATLQRKPLRYQVVASDARLDRRVMGSVTNSIRGVPAEPVDSIAYDGSGSRPIPGQVMMEVDLEAETGLVMATWTDEHGVWVYRQTRFLHPEHSSGMRMSTTKNENKHIVNHGVVANVYLHGDTTAGTAVVPTVFAYLGAWGPADVTLNGEPFENPFELPAPQWLGHLMVCEGVRDEVDGTIRATTGEIYDPARHATQGATDPHDLEFQLTFHDERFPRTKNKPSMYQFQMHLTFEDVEIRMVQANGPIPDGIPRLRHTHRRRSQPPPLPRPARGRTTRRPVSLVAGSFGARPGPAFVPHLQPESARWSGEIERVLAERRAPASRIARVIDFGSRSPTGADPMIVPDSADSAFPEPGPSFATPKDKSWSHPVRLYSDQYAAMAHVGQTTQSPMTVQRPAPKFESEKSEREFWHDVRLRRVRRLGTCEAGGPDRSYKLDDTQRVIRYNCTRDDAGRAEAPRQQARSVAVPVAPQAALSSSRERIENLGVMRDSNAK